MELGGWEWAILAGSVGLLLAGLWLLRRVTGSIFGPLFLYEMVVLARRGQQFRLRILLAVLLLIGLFLAYLKEFDAYELTRLFSGESVSLPMSRQAQFAETFLIAFMTVQLLAVLLIIPAMAGSAIAEEKERRSLDYLRTTLLTPWEIGMGKFFSRMVFLLGIIATGLPVLALAMNQGGMDLRVVFAGYVITLATAACIGGLSFYLGVVLDGLREVLLWVYGTVGALSIPGLCCGCIPGVAAVSPVSVMVYLFAGQWTSDPNEAGFWINVAIYGVIHTLIGMGFSLRAIVLIRIPPPIRYSPQTLKKRRKRRDTYYDNDDPDDSAFLDHGPQAEKLPPPPPPEPSRPRRPIARRTFRVERVPDTGNPFVWKERFFASRYSVLGHELSTGVGIVVLMTVLFGVGLTLFITAAMELDRGQWTGEAINLPLRLLMTIAVIGMGLVLGVRMASSVALERQRQTLDALLTIPVERWRILWAKVYAGLYLMRFVAAALLIVLFAGLVTAGLHPLGLVLGLFYSVGYVAFLMMYGLWMSIRCKTVTRATVYMIILTLVLWFGPLLASPLFDVLLTVSSGQSSGYNMTFASLSSPAGVWFSFFGWSDFQDLFQNQEDSLLRAMLTLAAGLANYAFALLCGLGAWRQFEREGK